VPGFPAAVQVFSVRLALFPQAADRVEQRRVDDARVDFRREQVPGPGAFLLRAVLKLPARRWDGRRTAAEVQHVPGLDLVVPRDRRVERRQPVDQYQRHDQCDQPGLERPPVESGTQPCGD
jgi:hypothetical protein